MANQMITTEQAAADLSDVVARLVEEAVLAERERIIAMLREFPFEITEPEHVEAMVAAIRAQGSP